MIEGLLRHRTDAGIEANYTDTHGASLVGFAFTELLGFKLLPPDAAQPTLVIAAAHKAKQTSGTPQVGR